MNHPIRPMLCGWGSVPAAGVDFAVKAGTAFEIKWDGYRMIAVKQGSDVQLYLRSGVYVTDQVWTDVIKESIRALPVDVVLDGEAIVLNDAGWPAFNGIQNRMSLTRTERETRLRFMAFDVLSFGRTDILDRPYSERRKVLETLVPQGGWNLTMGPSSTDATTMWKFVMDHELEGLISKPLSARYKAGERGTWSKHKRFVIEEFVIVGYEPGGRPGREAFGALLVAEPAEDGKLRVCGQVGTGFSDSTLKKLMAMFEPVRRDTPTDQLTRKPSSRSAVWVEPVIRCKVSYQERTGSNTLRGPAAFQKIVS